MLLLELSSVAELELLLELLEWLEDELELEDEWLELELELELEWLDEDDELELL